MKNPTLEEAVIARFAEMGFPTLIKESEMALFTACHKAFLHQGWVFIFDKRTEIPFYGALPPETQASCLYRLPKV